MIARLAIGLVLLFLLAVPLPASAIQVLAGGAVDATIYTPPCASFGFSVEAISTLPTGQNNARMVRVDRSGNTQTGYVVTSQATGYTVYTFDYRTMQHLGSTVVTPAGYRDAGRIQGDVSVIDGKLYLFHEVSTVDPLCPGNRCVVMARWRGNTLEASVTDTAVGAIGNIDDARESGSQFLIAVDNNATGTRVFRTYSKSSLARLAVGTNTTKTDFAHISRAMSSEIYGSVADNLTFPNLWHFPLETPTSNGNNSLSFASGVGLGIASIYPQQNTRLVIDSGNDTVPQRAFIAPPTTLTGPVNFTLTSANLGAAFQGGFYDSVNQKVFSLRRDNGLGVSIALRNTVNPATSEERFTCASCINSGGTTVGTQVVDYSQTYARMFVGSNETPARITKIKVCATGGPP